MATATKRSKRNAIKEQTSDSRAVIVTLNRAFPQAKVDAYRYGAGSIRVRIIDKQFHDVRPSRRYTLVSSAIESLPESVQSDIIFLVILTPAEHRAKISTHDFDFDHPLPLEE